MKAVASAFNMWRSHFVQCAARNNVLKASTFAAGSSMAMQATATGASTAASNTHSFACRFDQRTV